MICHLPVSAGLIFTELCPSEVISPALLRDLSFPPRFPLQVYDDLPFSCLVNDGIFLSRLTITYLYSQSSAAQGNHVLQNH